MKLLTYILVYQSILLKIIGHTTCLLVLSPCVKPGANPDDVFGTAPTVYRQQASTQGPGVADIQVAPYHTSRHGSPMC